MSAQNRCGWTQCDGPVSVQARVKLVQQVHLVTAIHKLLLHQCGDVQVDIRLGQRDLAVLIDAGGA
jgi:hypothetical protein